MSAEDTRKDRIESIFLDARDLPGEERDTFLAEACQSDTGLRKAVENLLRADGLPDSLLDGTVDVIANQQLSEEEYEGKAIGPYKLLQRIGEGGFGVVYMAEQSAPVRRKVALKLIKPGMDSKEVVARFEAERQALAMMDHPSIAKVLDAGTTESGRPYFAMELVKGVPITEYCDHNALSTQQRLELFNQVCRAVQHAHQKGVIHRDLKPTNVMVTLHDGKPVPKVIDFGVAKALSHHLTDKTLFTRYGQVVGTPQYMSPEQAEMSGMDVDTRSDIYSLGVLLYELLTGNTPLDASTLRSAGYDAMRKLICDLELAKPSTRLRTLDDDTATGVASLRSTVPQTLAKLVSGDLDWIVMKCLDKDRNRRYESANGLLKDVERYLHDEPVEAGPPTFLYQLTKLYQRNRAAVASMAAVGATLLVGITLTSIAWANESEQRKVAEEQKQIAEKEREASEENANEARQQAENAKRAATRAQTTLDVLKSLLTKASPDPEKGTDVTVSEFLDSFAADLDSVKLEDPRVEIEIRMTLAKALDRFSMSDEEEQQYEIAERIARKTYSPKSDELARFLLKRTAPLSGLAAVPLLEEALRNLEAREHSKVLEADVRTALGQSLAWDKPNQARAQFERACELVREMESTDRGSLQTNAFLEYAYHLRWMQSDAARQVAGEAVAFARQSRPIIDLVESLLFLRHFEKGRDRDVIVRNAWDVALDARNGEALAIVLDASCDELWDRGVARDDLASEANRLKNELVSNWYLLHGERAPLGMVWGMLLQVGDSGGAAELASLNATLPRARQQNSADGAGQWLRKAGMLRKASEMYDGDSPSQLWYHGKKGRCLSAARNFQNAIPFIEKAIELSQDNEITNPYWLRYELALFLEEAGMLDDAHRVIAELAPDVLRVIDQHPGFTHIALLCVAKSDCWDDLDVETLRSIEAELQSHLTEGEAKNLDHMLSAAALGLLEQNRGNREKQIDYFVMANRYRPGTFEQMNGEWISDMVVELLTEDGQIERLEKILRDDVHHRDESLPKIHPERAFTRIRLAETLIREQRKLDETKTLLDEASEVYAFHGDWIPAAEHETLKQLQQTVAALIKEDR